jgi:quercetin dioxygenase-like cupin family protein
MSNRTWKIIAGFIVMVAVAGAGSWSSLAASQDGTDGATPEPTVGVTREVLSETEPESAPGEIFALARYIIPAGAVLPVHTHPGVQLATVESGTLTYHVIENGSITVTRADGTEEVVGPGETVTLEVGDAWIEPEGMVHYAENLTTEDVVLMSSSLLQEGELTAIPVDVGTPVATPAA